MHIAEHYTEYVRRARIAEEEGDVDDAIRLYENAIKQKPLAEQPYSRLMTLYRNHKNYKDELRVINKALQLFIDHYDKRKASVKANNKVSRLSKAILKTIYKDAGKTENIYPQPIPKWEKRKAVVEKRLDKNL